MKTNRPLNLVQLQAELATAGVDVGAGLVAYTADGVADIYAVSPAGEPLMLSAAAVDVLDAHVAVNRQRAGVFGAASSAVGTHIAQLTAVQVRALLACLLFKADAIDDQLVIRPLADWLRP